MRGPAGRLIDEWLEARAALAEIERAEHPDIVDRHGRVWAWWKGDLYRHCGMAWSKDMVENPLAGLPTDAARSNPNYSFCALCAPSSEE